MRITLGPKEKKERRIGERLHLKGDRCDSPKCAAVRRSYPPGVHGKSGMRRRLTGFGLQLREKQKARLIYGLAERQFRNYVKRATARRGDTGLLLGQLLEQRLDNVTFRTGFARSRGEAREYVSHGHFMVNGKRVNIPSYRVRVGDVIEVRPASAVKKFFQEIITPRLEKHETPPWITREAAGLKGRVIALPQAEDLAQNIDLKRIIEFYSR
ncbi:30S ribosomal protein S4 [Candidatus Uhrbacteria bacterium]|nr:30S ribosomal protein S4 [Candidatus Uhrbacteria bacterium]